MSDWEATADRSLGEETLNILTCLFTLGLRDREMQKAGAYDAVGEPDVPGDNH